MASGKIPNRSKEESTAAIFPGVAEDVPAPPKDPMAGGVAGQIIEQNQKLGPGYTEKPRWSKGG
jgi:hypothetical protein